MHLATESHADRSIDCPGAFAETNMIDTYNMLEAARAHGERVERPEAHQGGPVIAYLENLLPDKQAIRERVAARVRAGGTDAWHMQEKIGRDCVGVSDVSANGTV